MYEEYMQNFLNYPANGYQNTYEQRMENYPYTSNPQNMLGYNFPIYNMENRRNMGNFTIEQYYPEIYKIVYPMVKKACSQQNRGITKDLIDNMVEEVYTNIEANDGINLNITLNNDVRGEKEVENNEEIVENRQCRRNNLLNDLIRILVLRELIGRPGCMGPNCYFRPRPPYMSNIL